MGRGHALCHNNCAQVPGLALSTYSYAPVLLKRVHAFARHMPCAVSVVLKGAPPPHLPPSGHTHAYCLPPTPTCLLARLLAACPLQLRLLEGENQTLKQRTSILESAVAGRDHLVG